MSFTLSKYLTPFQSDVPPLGGRDDQKWAPLSVAQRRYLNALLTSHVRRVEFCAALGMGSARGWEGPRGLAGRHGNAVPVKTVNAGSSLGPTEGLRGHIVM